MGKKLRIYEKMKKTWSEKIGGNQEKLKSYQMLYTLPNSFSTNLVLGFFSILGKLLKFHMSIWIFFASIVCFYLIYRRKKKEHEKICFVLKEIEEEIFQVIN